MNTEIMPSGAAIAALIKDIGLEYEAKIKTLEEKETLHLADKGQLVASVALEYEKYIINMQHKLAALEASRNQWRFDAYVCMAVLTLLAIYFNV